MPCDTHHGGLVWLELGRHLLSGWSVNGHAHRYVLATGIIVTIWINQVFSLRNLNSRYREVNWMQEQKQRVNGEALELSPPSLCSWRVHVSLRGSWFPNGLPVFKELFRPIGTQPGMMPIFPKRPGHQSETPVYFIATHVLQWVFISQGDWSLCSLHPRRDWVKWWTKHLFIFLPQIPRHGRKGINN